MVFENCLKILLQQKSHDLAIMAFAFVPGAIQNSNHLAEDLERLSGMIEGSNTPPKVNLIKSKLTNPTKFLKTRKGRKL